MAEIRSPLTGGLNVARRTVSAAAFAPAAAPAPAPAQPDPVTTGLIEKNANALTSVGTQLASIQQQVAALNNSMAQVYSGIQQNAAIDKNRDIQEQNQQRQLAEQQLREGKESAIERRIASAVVAPVQRIAGKVQFSLNSLMTFFGTLLAGWLLQQGVATIKAYAEGNKEKLKEIKNSIIKTLGIAAGIFVTIQFGLGRIIGVMTRLAGTIIKAVGMNLFVRPVQLLIDAVKAAAGKLLGIKPPAAVKPPGAKPPGPKGGKFGLMSLIGKTITGLSAGMNFLNGENIDGALAAMSIIPGKGVIFKGLRVAAGTLFTIDEVMEAFGGNLTGEKKKELEEAKTKKPESKPAQTQPVSQPTEGLMGEKKDEGVKPNPASGNIPSADAKGKDSGGDAAKVAPQTSMAPSASSLSLGAGMQEALTQGQASGMTESTSFQVSSSSTSPQITPIKTEPTVAAQSVGPLPEVTPTIIPMPMPAQQQQQSQTPPGPSGSAQEIPSFNPENSNNFYLMYSHSVYNVPMM